MNNEFIRNRDGRIVGRFDGNWLRDRTGKLVSRYDKWDDRTRAADGKIITSKDHRLLGLNLKTRCRDSSR